jgi:hypothetical protein
MQLRIVEPVTFLRAWGEIFALNDLSSEKKVKDMSKTI